MRPRPGELAVLFLVLAILAVGCSSSPPPGPTVNNSGDGNCILFGPGTGGDQNGNQGNSGTGVDCRPVGKPVLSPVPVVAVERKTDGGGASALTAGSVASIIAEFEAKR